MNYYQAILASMSNKFSLADIEEVNRERIEEFMELLGGQLGVVMQSGYDLTTLKFEIKGHKDSSEYPLAIEVELSWPENEPTLGEE